MNKPINLIIYLLLLTIIPSSGYASSQETERKPITELTLAQIIRIPWDMSLNEIEKQYPGGHLNPADPERKVVGNYILPIYLKDLKRKSSLNLHISSRVNYVEKRNPKLIKSITIFCDNSEFLQDIIENIQANLKHNFPSGGPASEGNSQVGYFIPTCDNFAGIDLRWTIYYESNSLGVIIQETKYK